MEMDKQLEGKLVEVAGEIVGYVVEENKKTLLIRKVQPTWNNDGFLLSPKAMFFDKASIVDAYWVKFLDSKLPVRSINELGEIRRLLDL